MHFPNSPNDLYVYHRVVGESGYERVTGIDEVGRGPLAGTVVAAAVSFPTALCIPDLNDSKKLSGKQREKLYEIILATPGIQVALTEMSPADIDRYNILRATHMAMRAAAGGLTTPPEFILVDGLPVEGFPCASRNVIKGDGKVACIAAASIVAKVTRDRQMIEMDSLYPGYGFANHKGYGTREHLDALKKLGPCPIHRKSFAPVAACLPGVLKQAELDLGLPT